MTSESNQTRHREPSSAAGRSSNNMPFNISIPPFRFAGDGFDMRRPVMQQQRQEFIDLTEDSSSPAEVQTTPLTSNPGHSRGAHRPPRYARNIIDLDEQDDVPGTRREESPEIQFLTSRRRTSGARSPVRRTHVMATLRPSANESHLRPRVGPPDRILDEELLAFGGMFEVPHLDFDAVAFNYENPSRAQQQPRLPTYEAPSPPQAGFTRSPKEDDVVVCPCCEDELGVGENEIKRQVWVVKACGHVSPLHPPLCSKLVLIHLSGLLW